MRTCRFVMEWHSLNNKTLTDFVDDEIDERYTYIVISTYLDFRWFFLFIICKFLHVPLNCVHAQIRTNSVLFILTKRKLLLSVSA